MRLRWCACGIVILVALTLVGCQKEIPEDLFLKGFQAFKQGDMIGAALYFDKFLEKYPENEYAPQAQLMMARARVRLGEFDVAEKDFRMLLRKYPNQAEGVNAALELADYYARAQNNPQKAEEEIRTVLDNVAEETRLEFLQRTASYYIAAATQPDRAEAILQELIAGTENREMKINSYQGIAEAYISAGTAPEKVAQALETVIELSDDELRKVNAYFQMAGAYVSTDDYDKAIEVYETVIDDVTADPEAKALAYLLISKGYERAGDMGKALDALEQLRSNYRETDVAIMSYIQSALFLKESSPELSDEFFYKALRAYGRVKDESPESDRAAWAQMKIAESYAQIGDATKAIEALGTAITDFPHMPQYVEMARKQIQMLRMFIEQEQASGEEVGAAS